MQRLHRQRYGQGEKFGIALADVEGFPTPVPAETTVCWALDLKKPVDTGDHTLFICEVADTAQVNDKKHLMAFDGYSRLDTAR